MENADLNEFRSIFAIWISTLSQWNKIAKIVITRMQMNPLNDENYK